MSLKQKESYRIVHEHIRRIMPKLRKEAGGGLPAPFLTVTWGDYYAAIFGWDNHHLSLRFAADGEIVQMRNYLVNMLNRQSPDGFTPNITSLKDGAVTEDFHAQPFLAQNAAIYLSLGGEPEFVREIFPKLKKYLDYYFRFMHWEKGLGCWHETYMSGIDNEISGTLFPPNTMLAADLNSFLVLECKAMNYLAEQLKLSAGGYDRKAQELSNAVNDLLWSENYGYYGNFNTRSGRVQLAFDGGFPPDGPGKYSFVSCVAFPVLFAGIPSRERAERMIREYLMNPKHFLGDYGLCSLSRSSEYYNNAVWGNPPRFGNPERLTNSNWQGPVWVISNYLAILGMIRYGFRAEAETVAERLLDTLAAGIGKYGSMRENYSGETGAPLYAERFASWNILADLLPDFIEGNPPFRHFPWE